MKRALCACLFVLAASSICSAQFTYYYPQVASGTYAGGRWQTTIFITNSGGVLSNGSITLTRDDGGPYFLNWVDDRGAPVASGNEVGFQLGAGETRKFVSLADAELSTGYATVTANAPVMGTALYTNFNSAGQILGEASVPAAIPLGRQALFVDTQNGFRTGLAIANPNNARLNITFELINTAGQKIGTAKRQVPPFQHMALFINELFPDAPPTVGRVQFWCVNPMTSVGLRFDIATGIFTTLPPVAIQ